MIRVLRLVSRALAAYYASPPAVVAASHGSFALLCYFVLPPSFGLPLVALVAPLPLYEEKLNRAIARAEREGR